MIEDFSGKTISSALQAIDKILEIFDKGEPAIFLDYDGTLTPIVDDPGKAFLPLSVKKTLEALVRYYRVAVISGRALGDVQNRVGITGIIYVGSHGFEISWPGSGGTIFRKGEAFLPALDRAEQMLRERLESVPGALVERKTFSIAVHYRKVDVDKITDVTKVVDAVASENPKLRKSQGKMVYELQPDMDWHKGKALFHILDSLNDDPTHIIPLYIGDDTTDEDAFEAVKRRGFGIVVMDKPRATKADYKLRDTNEVETFLKMLIASKRNGRC